MSVITQLKNDLSAALARDPAARNRWELVLLYPSLHAIWTYRVAHRLWLRRLRFAARWLSSVARAFTGIDIHPGARIGSRFFIDHGVGVVIGETTELGDDVLLYQGVTLGGTSLDSEKRHPTLGDRVVVGAGAKVLGPIDIGDDSRIGAGSVVIRPVPAGTVVAGIPARTLGLPPEDMDKLRHDLLDDPVAISLRALEERLRFLESRLSTRDDDVDESANG